MTKTKISNDNMQSIKFILSHNNDAKATLVDLTCDRAEDNLNQSHNDFALEYWQSVIDVQAWLDEDFAPRWAVLSSTVGAYFLGETEKGFAMFDVVNAKIADTNVAFMLPLTDIETQVLHEMFTGTVDNDTITGNDDFIKNQLGLTMPEFMQVLENIDVKLRKTFDIMPDVMPSTEKDISVLPDELNL